MSSQLQFLSTQHALLFSYVFSYYAILSLIIALFFLWNIRSIRFVSELGFFANCSFLHFTLILACISLAGLPPLFFFFPKFSLLSAIILQNSWYMSLCTLLLIMAGWFLYLTLVKAASVQCWSFSSTGAYGSRYVNTGLSLLATLGFWLLIFGFFFIDDFFIQTFWLFQ